MCAQNSIIGAGRDDHPSPQQASSFADDTSPPTGQPVRILLVEDEFLIALEIEQWLLNAGYDLVASVNTAIEAINAAEVQVPDLVIMDIRLLGDLDGIYAANEICKRFGIRSLFASAHVDKDAQIRATRADPLGWLPKPFGRRDFLDALAKAVSQLERDGPE